MFVLNNKGIFKVIKVEIAYAVIQCFLLAHELLKILRNLKYIKACAYLLGTLFEKSEVFIKQMCFYLNKE